MNVEQTESGTYSALGKYLVLLFFLTDLCSFRA